MASNPFDQFDEATGNPFDQFDAPKAEKSKEAPFGKQLLSAAVRPAVNAIAGLATLPLDAGYGLGSFLREKRMPTLNDFNPFAKRTQALPSDIVQGALDKYTVAPSTTGGKLAEMATTMLMGAKLPGMPTPSPSTVARTEAQAAARAQAGVEVGPGNVGASTTVNMAPEMRAQGGGYTFGNVGEDASAGLNIAKQDIARRGRQIGMRMTPGQMTGSKALQQMEAKLESQPMTSGPFNALKESNAQVVNRAAAHSIGERASVVNSDTLDRAFTRIGRVFDDSGDDVSRSIDPDRFLETVSRLEQETQGMGMPVGIGEHPLVNEVMNLASRGQATGEQLQQLTSKLGKAAYKQMTTPSGDRDLGGALHQFKNYVDDLLQQGMDPRRLQRFANARTQYRNLMMLTNRTGVVNPSSGDVAGKSLATVLQKGDKSGFLRGHNRTPMYEAARFAQAFGPIVGDSGTATRMPLQGLTDMVTRIPLNLTARAYLSSPSVRAFAAGQGVANSRAAQIAQSAIMPHLQIDPRMLPALYQQGLFGPDE